MQHDLVIVGNDCWGAMLAREAAELNLTVALLEQRDRIGTPDVLPKADLPEDLLPKDVSQNWNRLGIDFLQGEVQFIGSHQLLVMNELSERMIRGRHFVLACGVRPDGRGRIQFLQLDRLGVGVDEHQRLWCNPDMQTWVPHIYGLGDVVGYPANAGSPELQMEIILEQIRPTDWSDIPDYQSWNVDQLCGHELVTL